MRRIIAAGLTAALTLTACSSGGTNDTATSEEQVLNVYSSRHYDVDKEVYKMFEDETGIKLNVVEGKGDELVERISREKGNPQADMLLTVGAESIYPLQEAGALEGSTSSTIEANIPEQYRGDNWMGITSRARVIAYAKDRVKPEEIKTYEDITKEEWKQKVLVRPANSSYNQALLASFIQQDGEEEAKQWSQGVVDNMAREPKGNDRDQAKAVAAGEGDLAIMNSYYYVRMANSSDAEEVKAAEKIGLIFPEKTHLNLSYGAVLKGAKNKDNAIKLLEFLSSEKIQELYAQENGEFPLNKKAPLPEVQQSWGEFTTQDINFEELGKYRDDATKIFDETGWK